ncbi:MAG: S-adenosylmethionine:tRNA ribosyltransferase-isomerase [Bacteroidales bacterium]|nr:S-adenosylmethionine:tRNA ribosyltransferase-isomerase [Bacteroidales bacterium]MBN2821032.1 S-adenosylmethionine:tRNA ribosyltransferase-isomerase [Bacteroidales bacterium]
MTHPIIKIKDYSYALPENRIAKYPLEKRDESKLLLYAPEKEITHTVFHDITKQLPEKSLLVYNNTRVIHARLKFRKKTGASVEIFCLSPYLPVDYQQALSSTEKCQWECLVGNMKKWKDEDLELTITINNLPVTLLAHKTEASQKNNPVIEFSWDKDFSFAELLQNCGTIPIPPYLNRESEESDSTRYQTIYSELDGSVAAPTAGLHFTTEVLNKLTQRNINAEELTLHVGAGTFIPVKADNAREHQMHGERIFITRKLLQKIITSEGPIVATGTTSLRTLESLYWIGVKSKLKMNINCLNQWDWENTPSEFSVEEALNELLIKMDAEQTDEISATTEIMIVPGYEFKIVKGLITNFHQPQSTLLLLIAAFVGERWKEIYSYALENDFRFLSYGDSSLLLR